MFLIYLEQTDAYRCNRSSWGRWEQNSKSTGLDSWSLFKFKQEMFRSCNPPPQMALFPLRSTTLQSLQPEATNWNWGWHEALEELICPSQGLYSIKWGQVWPPEPSGSCSMRLWRLSRPRCRRWSPHGALSSSAHGDQGEVTHWRGLTQVLTSVGTTVWVWPSTQTLEDRIKMKKMTVNGMWQ